MVDTSTFRLASPAGDEPFEIHAQGDLASNPLSLADQGMVVTAFSFNELEINLTSNRDVPAWLIYADAWHPDWRVTVDDEPTTLFKVDGAFKGVRIPPKARQVRFDFHQVHYQGLYWLMMVAAILVMGWGFSIGLRKPKEGFQGPGDIRPSNLTGQSG